MKKMLFYMAGLVALCAGLTACGEDPEEVLPPVINVEKIDPLPAEGGEFVLNYTIANPVEGQTVAATSTDSFLKDFDCSTSGKIRFTAEANTLREARTGEVTVSYPGAESVSVQLMQAAAEAAALTLSVEKLEFAAEGEELSVEVTAEAAWTLKSVEWLTPSIVEGEGNAEVTFTAGANTTDAALEGEVIFTCEGRETKLAVSQPVYVVSDVLEVIADNNFRKFLKANVLAEDELTLTPERAAEVTKLEIEWKETGEVNLAWDVRSLEGIEYFPNLTELIVRNQKNLKTIDLSKNTKLTQVDVSYNALLRELNVTNCSAIEILSAANDPRLTTIDLTSQKTLRELYLWGGKGIEEIDITPCTQLEITNISGTFTEIDLSKSTALKKLTLLSESLESVDLKACTLVERLTLSNCSSLRTIDVTMLPLLNYLNVSSTPISTLDLSKNANLETLWIDFCSGLKELDLSYCPKLNDLYAHQTSESLVVWIYEGQYIISYTGVSEKQFQEKAMEYPEDCAAGISDAPLKQYILNNFDTNKDGKISGAEAVAATEINVSGLGITSMEGLTYFSKLQTIDCSNNKLTVLDLSAFQELKTLYCQQNEITSLDFSRTASIQTVDCSNNALSEGLNFGLKTAAQWVNASNNNLKSFAASYLSTLHTLDLSNNPELSSINVHQAGVVDLNVDNTKADENLRLWGLKNLERFSARYTLFTDLSELSGLEKLLSVDCTGTLITTLDLSKSHDLEQLIALECDKLTEIFLPAGPVADLQVEEGVTVHYASVTGIQISEELFPESLVLDAAKKADTDGDGYLSEEEIAAVTEISIRYENFWSSWYAKEVTTLAGLELFPNVESLRFGGIMMETLDLSWCTNLKKLELSECGFSALNIPGEHLTSFSYGVSDITYYNDVAKITEIDLSIFPNLNITEDDFSISWSCSKFYVLESQKEAMQAWLDAKGRTGEIVVK